jgi:DNA-directed RNA polymerase specialized sigma24 family protein
MLDMWFSRCFGVLHFIACRVLGGPEGADLAIANCWVVASRSAPSFVSEGAFRSWLLRVLIDEALIIRRQGDSSKRAEARIEVLTLVSSAAN